MCDDYCNCEDCCWSRAGEQVCSSCGCLESSCPCGESDEHKKADLDANV